jgi:hypothetical protein
MAQKWQRPLAVPKLSLECQAIIFPQFPLYEQRPLGEAEPACGRTKSRLKRQKALFCDQVTQLHDSKRWLVAPAEGRRNAAENTFF